MPAPYTSEMLFLWNSRARARAASRCAGDVPEEAPQKTQTTRRLLVPEIGGEGRCEPMSSGTRSEAISIAFTDRESKRSRLRTREFFV